MGGKMQTLRPPSSSLHTKASGWGAASGSAPCKDLGGGEKYSEYVKTMTASDSPPARCSCSLCEARPVKRMEGQDDLLSRQLLRCAACKKHVPILGKSSYNLVFSKRDSLCYAYRAAESGASPPLLLLPSGWCQDCSSLLEEPSSICFRDWPILQPLAEDFGGWTRWEVRGGVKLVINFSFLIIALILVAVIYLKGSWSHSLRTQHFWSRSYLE